MLTSLSLVTLISALCFVEVIALVGAVNSNNESVVFADCAELNERFRQTGNVCRCFSQPDRLSWVGCMRGPMPIIHAALKNLPNFIRLDKLWLWNDAIPILPMNFFGKFRLRSLIIEDSVLEMIRPGVFEPLTMKSLEIKHNRLITLDDDVFSGLQDLQHLTLSNNFLKQINQKPFAHLGSLRSLMLDGNQIGRVESASFGSLSNLQQLHLGSNKLEQLSVGTFDGLRQLEYLNLENNSIRQIEPDSFKELKNLRILILRNNQLSNLVLEDMPKLEKLILSANKFSSLDHIKLNNLPALKHLNLDQNLIEAVGPHSLIDLPNLLTLSISRNRISIVDVLAFSGLNKLHTLSLQNNSLSDWPEGALEGMPNLKQLFLSQNKISFWNMNEQEGQMLEVLTLAHNQLVNISLPSSNNIHRLYLNDNQLRYLAVANVDFDVDVLHSIDLSDNAWVCTCDPSSLRLLEWCSSHTERLVRVAQTQCLSGGLLVDAWERLESQCEQLPQTNEQQLVTVLGLTLGVMTLVIMALLVMMLLKERRVQLVLRSFTKWSLARVRGATDPRHEASLWAVANRNYLRRIYSDMEDLLPKTHVTSSSEVGRNITETTAADNVPLSQNNADSTDH